MYIRTGYTHTLPTIPLYINLKAADAYRYIKLPTHSPLHQFHLPLPHHSTPHPPPNPSRPHHYNKPPSSAHNPRCDAPSAPTRNTDTKRHSKHPPIPESVTRHRHGNCRDNCRTYPPRDRQRWGKRRTCTNNSLLECDTRDASWRGV